MVFVTNDHIMGKNIRCLRQREGMTLEEFAGKMGISASVLEGIETGAILEIQYWVLCEICDFFSTDIETLVETIL